MENIVNVMEENPSTEIIEVWKDFFQIKDANVTEKAKKAVRLPTNSYWGKLSRYRVRLHSIYARANQKSHDRLWICQKKVGVKDSKI